MPVLFEYGYHDDFLHNAKASVKFIFFTCLATLAGLWMDPVYLSVLLVGIIIVLRIIEFPREWLLLLVYLSVMLLFGYATLFSEMLLIDPAFFRVYPPEITQIALFRIDTPFGEWGLTVGFLIFRIGQMLRMSVFMFIGCILVYTTKPIDFIEFMMSYRVPFPAVFTLFSAFRFFPIIVRDTETTFRAQSLRGWEVKTRNPIKIFRQFEPIIYPFARIIVEMIENLSISCTIRCFGVSKRVNPLVSRKLSMVDYIMTIICVPVMLVLLYGLFVYNWGLI